MRTLYLSVIIVLVFSTVAIATVSAQTNDSGPEPQPVKDWLANHPNFTGCVHTDLKTGESKEVTCIHPELIPGGLYEPKNNTHVMSPLKQFKSGIAADDVKCGPGLQLVIKTKDGSPACVKSHTAQKLVERKWGWAMQPIDSIKPLPNRITDLENNAGMVTFENQTYYFVTPNYTETSYIHPVQIVFHDVNFTLFPPGFRGGLPLGGCPGQYYWVDAKFADGMAELLHIYAGSQSCADSVPIMLNNHIIPQAGLAFSDGKMMLLVRDESQAGKDIVLQKPSSMEKPFPHCNSSPAKEKLIREKQQVLQDALLSEEQKHGGYENRTQNLPWSFIGYDCVDNALEVGIPPQYFNPDSLPKYFEKIRSIVGNTIDVVLSPQDYALPL